MSAKVSSHKLWPRLLAAVLADMALAGACENSLAVGALGLAFIVWFAAAFPEAFE